ncbi:hypothetical protein V7147_02740 [Bacillus sp. JJ1521]|uniref:hypothetical protein n=1 Tax=Bacillus sp. JJ1521 TaxID=3122957 RepID=UPI0030007D4B
MKEIILLITEIVNTAHDIIEELAEVFGLNLNDKDLHFWVIGIIGFLIFIIVHITFKWIAEWSITAISFVYTFTVLLVIVFAIEIQQKITGRGNMEFADAVIGLYGFLTFFLGLLIIKFITQIIIKLIKKKNSK